MKTTSVTVLALFLSSTLAQPIILLSTRNIAPTEVTNLEAREDGDLSLEARDFTGNNRELLARYFNDDFLEARDVDMLEARDFHDNYLEARDVDGMLVARHLEDGYLEARDLDVLEARNFEDDYLEARDFNNFEFVKRFGGHNDGAGPSVSEIGQGTAPIPQSNRVLGRRSFSEKHPHIASAARTGGGIALSAASDTLQSKLFGKRGGQYGDLSSLG